MRPVQEVAVEIGGRTFRVASDDDYLAHLRGEFEPEMVRLFQALAGSDAILDIGANIGCTALLFGGMTGTVHAFEPSPTTFAFLERNLARAALPAVRAHNFGLGQTAGRFPLSFAPSNRSGGFVSDRTRGTATHAVETIEIRRLDDVMGELNVPRVGFIKIDVEGFEGHVLRGAAGTLAAHRPTVVLELNHWCLNAFQRTSVPDFLDQLLGLFPVLLAVDGDSYLDLRDESDRFLVMYYHILHRRFPNLVGAFDEGRLADFRARYRHGFTPPVARPAGGGLLSRARGYLRRAVGR